MAERRKEEEAPAVGDDGVFEIDRVVDIMWANEEEDEAPQYRVRWKGFPPIEDTWEPIENFTTATRRTVREFVRHYTKLQMKESRFQREIGQGNGKLCRHVNILSREVLTISSMRCDTTRQPPLWFYLVVWRNERPEDATWESELYLRHATDLIHQYRAKHPTSPITTSDCASRSPRGLVLPATTSQKLFLDGPAPRKQKEKMAFVDNLIDDSVLLSQAKSAKGTQPKKRPVEFSSRQVEDKCKVVHKFDGDILGKSKLAVNKGTKAIKLSSCTNHGTNEGCSNTKQFSVDELAGDVIAKKVPDHLNISKSYSTSSRHTKQQTGASTSRGNLNQIESDAAIKTHQNVNLDAKELESQVSGSGDRFKRTIVESHASESSDETPSNDDINFYKTKFIRDDKLEEKKRRKQLMKNRKETDAGKNTKKMQTLNRKGTTPGSDENRHNERPFSEKDQFCKANLPNVKNEPNKKCAKGLELKQQTRADNKTENEIKSKNKTKNKSRYDENHADHRQRILDENHADHRQRILDENHADHRQRILEKFGNIFGYDTDSEDLTLSPGSHCPSLERLSPLNTSDFRRLSLTGDCSPSSSASSHSYVHVNEVYSKDNSTATNAKGKSVNSSTSRTSSNSILRSCRRFDRNKKTSNSVRQSGGTHHSGDRIGRGKGFSNNFERCALASENQADCQLEAKRDVSFESTSLLSGLKEYVPLSSTDSPVQQEKVAELREDDLLAAINCGDSDVLLHLLSLPDILLPSLPFLCLLTEAVQAGHRGVAQVLAALCWGVDAPASHNQDQWERVVETAAAMGDLSLLLVLSTLARSLVASTTCAPSTLSRGLQMCAQGGAQRCAQQHVLAALNTSLLTF